MTSSERDRTRYARAIERCWSGLRERPVVLSPRDWALVCDWFDRGIPLDVVRECLVDAAARARAADRPRSLASISPGVEDSWRTVRGGRLVATPKEGDAARNRGDWLGAWRERADQEPPDSRLRALLHDLLSRADKGESAERLDALLDDALEEALPPEEVDRARVEARGTVEAYRDRMRPEAYEKTMAHKAHELLRRRLNLPRP